MHESVMAFGQASVTAPDVTGKRVIEVGSQNVNGSLRGHVEALGPLCYIGVDFAAGLGVDIVCDASDLVRHFGTDTFDTIISTEMLEHAGDWRSAISAMKRVLVPGGLILLTARGPGFHLHGYPHDWHRFTRSDMGRIFSDFEIVQLADDHQAPGVMILARKPLAWSDTVDLASICVAPADEVNAPRLFWMQQTNSVVSAVRDQPAKKTLCLIIDADPHEAWRETYETHRQNWNKCLDRSPGIDGYFLRADPALPVDHTVDARLCVIRGEERYDTIFNKTVAAIRILLKDHDYVIRTNLSSMWDFRVFAQQNFSTVGLYTGYTWATDPPFVSGAGMVMSRDVAETLARPTSLSLNPADDIAIAQVLAAAGIHPQHRPMLFYDYTRGLEQLSVGTHFNYRLRDINDPHRIRERDVSNHLFAKLYQ